MKKTILVFLFVGLCNSFFSQNEKLSFIEVTGTSETEVTPDEIYISITLKEKGDSKEKSIEKQEDDLKSGLKGVGIDMANLQLSTANADFRKIKTFKKDVVTSKSYILKVNNVDLVDKVYKLMDELNVFDAYISKLNHSKITELTAENREKAVVAAKNKAKALAMAVGNNIGIPISIIETANSVDTSPYNNRYYRGSYASNVAQSLSSPESLDSDGDEISFKKIKIRSSFLVKYELK
ncbi:MAG: SIMPL domain-containing protein [Sphingobacteriaceae bacterium]|nr:SIMPL domain-containing protein [Sphingobacteriaceae bacterium]